MTRNAFRASLKVATVAIVMIASAQRACPQTSPTGPKRPVHGKALRDALAHRSSLTTSGARLRETLADIQLASGITLLLDRRVDPSTQLAVTTKYVTYREIISAVAKAASLSVSFGDHYVILGPTIAVERVRTLTELNREMVLDLRRKLSADVYRKLGESQSASWPKLTEPRQLLIDAAMAAGVRIVNPNDIPHDLWGETTLPDLTFGDLATLVLNQFDLTIQLTPDAVVQIVPVPDAIVIERRHRVPAREKNAIIKKWKSSYPKMDVTWRGSTATVLATIETHEHLEELVRGKRSVTIRADGFQTRLFGMKASGKPFGQLIVSFRKSGVPIRIEGKTDEELRPLLQQKAKFDLANTPGAEFFPKIFDGWEAEVIVNADEVVLRFPTAE